MPVHARAQAEGTSKPLKADAPLLPDPPPPTWREVFRRPSFRASLLRQSLPVVGVLALGWPALDVALFFLLDVWLYLSVRAGCGSRSTPGTPGRIREASGPRWTS